MNLTSWQREIIKDVPRGARRIVLLQLLERSGFEGLVRVDRTTYAEISAHTTLSHDAILKAINSAASDGYLKVWIPKKPSKRSSEELIIELLEK